MRADRTWISSIQFKATALVCALTGALVVFLATYLSARHVGAERRALEDKALLYGRLVSEQVESGVAFDDRETVREVFSATALDTDVRGMALYAADGRELFALGALAGGPVSRDVAAGEVRLAPGAGDRPCATARVVSREGPTGTLVVELSTAHVEAEQRATRVAAAIAALASLAAGFVAAWWLASSLSRRLGSIASATRAVAQGDLSSPPIADQSHDEVGQLAGDFPTPWRRTSAPSWSESGIRARERPSASMGSSARAPASSTRATTTCTSSSTT